MRKAIWRQVPDKQKVLEKPIQNRCRHLCGRAFFKQKSMKNRMFFGTSILSGFSKLLEGVWEAKILNFRTFFDVFSMSFFECGSEGAKIDQKCENQEFWAPKTHPKCPQNAFKIDVPKNMRFFMDFCSIFVACCKSRTSKFMRPRSVLLMLHTKRIFAFCMDFGTNKPTKNPKASKTRSEPFKNQYQKGIVFLTSIF